MSNATELHTERLDWKRAHEDLARLARRQHALDFEIGKSLVRALRLGAHAKLGFGSFVEYAGRMLGYSPRMVQERLRVAEALETLPEIASALRRGELPWSAVRELTRVATVHTERDWIRVARGRTLREVEQRVAGRRPGDRPEDKADPSLVKHVLRFELSAETHALFREMMAKIRRDSPDALDDDAVLMQAAREVLGGPEDEGRSGHQILMHVCPRCGVAEQEGNGDRVEVSGETIEAARCDAQILGDPTHVGARSTQTIPPAIRRFVLRRDDGRCRVPGCRHTRFVDVHHLDLRSEGGGHDPENLVTLCGAHHRALHRGEIVASGTATNASFRHADGRPYGLVTNAKAVETSSKIFFALRHMGFREAETRRAVDAIATHVGEGEPLEKLIPRALAVLVPDHAVGVDGAGIEVLKSRAMRGS